MTGTMLPADAGVVDKGEGETQAPKEGFVMYEFKFGGERSPDHEDYYFRVAVDRVKEIFYRWGGDVVDEFPVVAMEATRALDDELLGRDYLNPLERASQVLVVALQECMQTGWEAKKVEHNGYCSDNSSLYPLFSLFDFAAYLGRMSVVDSILENGSDYMDDGEPYFWGSGMTAGLCSNLLSVAEADRLAAHEAKKKRRIKE